MCWFIAGFLKSSSLHPARRGTGRAVHSFASQGLKLATGTSTGAHTRCLPLLKGSAGARAPLLKGLGWRTGHRASCWREGPAQAAPPRPPLLPSHRKMAAGPGPSRAQPGGSGIPEPPLPRPSPTPTALQGNAASAVTVATAPPRPRQARRCPAPPLTSRATLSPSRLLPMVPGPAASAHAQPPFCASARARPRPRRCRHLGEGLRCGAATILVRALPPAPLRRERPGSAAGLAVSARFGVV